MNLNPEQLLAVQHIDGPCIVTAVPGAGKTFALTSRIAHLIEKGVDPSNILAVTFTNKAAEEMRSRVAKMVGQRSEKIWISTFHRLCLAILRKYGHVIGISSGFTIYDDKDQSELITKIARMHEYENCDKNKISYMQKIVNDYRENLDDEQEVFSNILPIEAAIIKEYLELLREFNAVDFSDMLYQTWRLIKNNESVAEKISNKFKYVLEDEAQDANSIQYDILKMIAPPPNGNLFVVGDFAQSIYGWRGAKPENLNKMNSEYDNVANIILPRNYRSTEPILRAAQSLIRNNSKCEHVQLISMNGQGPEINIINHDDPESEAEHIVNSIKGLRSKHNYQWSDFAVLYRVNQLSKVPEMVFRKHNIPYKIVGGFSFFDRAEIKTAIAYWSFFANQYDTIAFSRAISNPKRNVGEVMIGKIERFCQVNKISIIEAHQRLNEIDGISTKAKKSLKEFMAVIDKNQGKKISEITTSLLKDTGYYDYLLENSKNDPTDKKRIDNLNELLSDVVEFETEKPSSTIADYLQSIQLFSDKLDAEEQDSVLLLTMHSAKGREWQSVYIIGAEEGFIPHSRSVAEGNIEEERRLMYVGITRSRVHLNISSCTNRNRFDMSLRMNMARRSRPSRFLAELA